MRGEALTVESLAAGGRGVATMPDGRKAFISGAFPGDEVCVLERKIKKKFVEVTAFQRQATGPDQIPPACPHFESCGGCDWMPLSVEAQKVHKLSIVKEALRRIGGIDLDALGSEIEWSSAGGEQGYRSRVRLQVKDGRLGFFEQKSHRLVRAPDCLVMSPGLARCVELVYEHLDGDDSALSCVRSIEVRALLNGEPDRETCSVYLALENAVPGKGRAKWREARAKLAAKLGALQPSMLIRCSDEPSCEQRMHANEGVYAYAPVGSFTQVNLQVNAQLVQKVVAIAQESGAKSFLDLYCGCGNFSLPLAFAGLTGMGVEVNRDSIHAAGRAADEQGLPIQFLAASVDDFLGTPRARATVADIAVLDPPRSGAKNLLASLLKLQISRVLMVSCEPGTLARDLKVLVQGGYELNAIHAFDMFPQTHHVETLALLTRN